MSPIIRYAAAAVVTGIIVMAGFRFSVPPDKQNAVASVDGKNTVTEAIGHGAETIAVNKKREHKPHCQRCRWSRNDAALEESKHTFAKLDINRSKTSAIAADSVSAAIQNLLRLLRPEQPVMKKATQIQMTRPTVTYYSWLPEGHVIRVSKKLSNMVCCVSVKEADQQCKKPDGKMEKAACLFWRFTSNNFMDILSLVGSCRIINNIPSFKSNFSYFNTWQELRLNFLAHFILPAPSRSE